MKTWPALDLTLTSTAAADDAAGHLAAFLDDYAPTAIVDTSTPSELAWRVFFATPEARQTAASALARERGDVRVGVIDVPDEQWAERSQASLRAIRIGRLVVAPPWDVDAAHGRDGSDAILVVIEPSMGFGTGHHESTRLCLHALQQIDLRAKTMIDLGTGSGVLAIAAARLGCAHAVAVDDDGDAVDAARLNVARNGVADRVDVRQADLSGDPTLRGDVVVGNLTGALLRRLAGTVMACVAPGGTLVLSGFTRDERVAVEHAFQPLTVHRADEESGWIALTLR